jgi:hypothetical protein
MGGVVEFLLCVLRLRSTSVAQRWEASFERTVRVPIHFGGLARSTKLEGTLEDVHCFGRVLPKGWLRC